MSATTKPSFLVAGGDQDPNLVCLMESLDQAGIETIRLLTSVEHSPTLSWDLIRDELSLDGQVIQPTAAFIRHDVFTSAISESPSANYRAFAWYTAVAGWLAAHPNVGCLNRGVLHTHLNKPHVLHIARDAGLRIPKTVISNEINSEAIRRMGSERIAKPVTGGGYCQKLSALEKTTELRNNSAAAPAIIQNELIQPEIRIYRIGDKTIPFRVISDELDYRTTRQTRVEPVHKALPDDLIEGLECLMKRLGLEFGAADFKTDSETGALLFLEINTSPMFAAFDRVSGHGVSKALINELTCACGQDIRS